jgi:putative ATP-dependent endonuclease of the OLD family
VQFLRKVASVKVQIPQDRRYRALRRNCEIVIDDGSPTALEYKGDGVQSLAAIAIMRHASERASGNRNTVIAIEEPESHLHPEAIHEIRDVISELSNKYQIVLTMHNPLFVDRLYIHRNIVVNQSRARPAKSIEEVRRILGVRASDNLRHANLVLIVEGEEDRVSLRALLAHHSAAIRMALDKNVLVIDILGGASNLAYKLGLIRDSLCLHHSFLDDDEAGRKGFERARDLGLTSDSETNFTVC